MPTKQELTAKVLDLLGQQTGYNFESAMLLWWQDNRDCGGMRLTVSGHEQFAAAGLEHWRYDIQSFVPTPTALLVLKRHLTMPYYLQVGKKHSVTFYGSREALMFALYGDIDRFVLALKDSG